MMGQEESQSNNSANTTPVSQDRPVQDNYSIPQPSENNQHYNYGQNQPNNQYAASGYLIVMHQMVLIYHKAY